mgnify:CR=1 FL=1
MLPLFKILIVLFVAIVVVLFITSRNPTPLSDEQYAKYGKIIRILIPIALVASVVRFVFM